jgi:hypothetical protein
MSKIRQRAQTSRVLNIIWRLAQGAGAGRARGLLVFWQLWERLARRLWPPQPIPNAPHGIFAVRVTRYHGAPVDLPDGTRVEEGDLVAEMHINSQILVDTVRQYNWGTIRLMMEDFRALAAWVSQPTFPAEVKAFYGVTLLSSPAARMGWTIRKRPVNLRSWFERLFLTGLIAIYNPEGTKRLTRGTTYGTYPQEAWMSRNELLHRYR